MTPGTLNNTMTNFIKVYFFLIKYVLRTVYCLYKSMFKLYVKKVRNAQHAIFFVIMTYTFWTYTLMFLLFSVKDSIKKSAIVEIFSMYVLFKYEQDFT